MRSDGGIFYHEPAQALWRPTTIRPRPQNLSVRFKTEICDCDARGNVIRSRVTHQGHNTITDWGMDALKTAPASTLVNYLHLGSALGAAKRVLPGGVTLTLTFADPTSITATADANFFDSGDVGNTLWLDALGQELKITGYTSATVVTCATRSGDWLPSITPPTSGDTFSTASVHFTSVNTLASQITKFNTYDTSAFNYQTELNDSGNSRVIHQRIFLSGVVSGAAWTVNQLGWSDGNGGNNVFGAVNLAAPDVVAIGKKYRVTLQLFSGYTPIDIASQSVNWGATIGTYDLKIVQERIGGDSNGLAYLGYKGNINAAIWNFLRPYNGGFGNISSSYSTVPQTPQAVKWFGDAGFAWDIHYPSTTTGAGQITDASYTNGSHNTQRTIIWPDVVNIAAATMLGLAINNTGDTFTSLLSVFPNSGTITKPSGYWCALTFQIFWTRQLVS